MGIATLTTQIQVQVGWTAQGAAAGTGYQPLQNGPTTLTKLISTSSATGNTGAGGADELISKIYSVGSNSSVTIDLTNLTDILGTSAVSLARVKGLVIRLLSVADDAVNGTAAASITVGNAGSNPASLWFSSTNVVSLKNGGAMAFSDPSATGYTVGGSTKNLLIANNDTTTGAGVQITIIGGST